MELFIGTTGNLRVRNVRNLIVEARSYPRIIAGGSESPLSPLVP
jgi:hypothetical protein